MIDIAALTDLTEDEVRQTGVQNNLVALHLAGNVPKYRQDLQRLAQGETMIRPSGPPVGNATGPAAIDAALGINVSTGNVGSANARAGMPAPANAGMEPGTLMGHLPRVLPCRMSQHLLLPRRVGRMRL